MSDGEVKSPKSFIQSGVLIAERYRVQRILGAGGSGYVVLCEDITYSGTPVVVKLLYSHLLQNPQAFARFRNETAIAFDLSHPNIVQTYSFERWSDFGFFITMEYLPRGSLKDLLVEQGSTGLNFSLVLEQLRMVMQGLHYAHKRGVIHRDIKPDNILLTETTEPKIADFGLSQMLWGEVSITRAGDVLGTPHYMSPEQIESKAIDIRSDIYSLGITTFELLTGRVPYEATTIYELAVQHLQHPLPRLGKTSADVPQWFQEFLDRCCKKCPSDRFSSLAQAAEFLESHTGSDWSLRTLGYAAADSRQQRVVQMQQIVQQRIVKGLLLVAFIVLPIITAIHSRQHPPLRRRLAAAILFVEYRINLELTPLRAAFGIEVVRGDRDAFFDRSKAQQGMWPLLEAGMDPNFYNEAGQTPLHFHTQPAFAFSAAEHVERLLAAGSEVDAKTPEGRTPLMNCVAAGAPQCVELLLKVDAAVNTFDVEGRSVLEYGVETGNTSIVQMLLQAGADPNSKSSEDTSLIEYTKRHNLPQMHELLEHYSALEAAETRPLTSTPKKR